jgi:lipopolysaccharide biosynthesis glycosyltransferase
MIIKGDVKELFDLADDRFSVMCVKHNQIINSETKFGGNKQESYSLKNWSSVMLFNNAKCRALTLEYVNTAAGLDMHQFKWLDNLDDVGELPMEWNFLVDNANQTDKPPKLLHYTDGGPYFEAYADCGYNEDYNAVYKTINDYRKH